LYLRVFDLEREVGSITKDEDDDDKSDGVEEPLCTDLYCLCPYHKKKGPPPPPPPPPPPTMGCYCGEGAT